MNEAASLLGIGIALLIGAASPGPSFVMVSRTAASYGRSAGMQAALGMGFGALAFALAALLGLNAALLAAPKFYVALKLAGGVYLAYLGYRIWQGATQPLDISIEASSVTSTATAKHFLLGFFTQVSNPKTAIVYASVFAAFLPSSPSISFCALICALVFVVEVAWYSTIAFVLSAQGARSTYMRSKIWIDRASGAIMGVLAARLFASASSD